LTRTIDLGLSLLDHQLLDPDGRRCGKVDDLALEGGPGEPLEVVAVLSGRRKTIRIPWEEIENVAAHVKLRKRADELGLGRGDDRLRPYIEKIPGANR
jgi:sporulation protein YlmC with PRC-barrel domain